MPGSKQQRLSRDLILEAAKGMVGDAGLDALSMRRLAQELDVWPMSIYRYFRDKDELLDALAESAAEAITAPSARGSWRSQLHALLGEARQVLGQDGSALSSRLAGMLKLSEAGLAILLDAGFDERRAARAWRALLSYTFGFAPTAMQGDGATLRTRSAIAALPDETYPALHAAGAELARALAADDEFARGLDLLLDGLEGGAS